MQVNMLHKTDNKLKSGVLCFQRWIWVKTRYVSAVKNFTWLNAQRKRLRWSYTTRSHAVLLTFFSRYPACTASHTCATVQCWGDCCVCCEKLRYFLVFRTGRKLFIVLQQGVFFSCLWVLTSALLIQYAVLVLSVQPKLQTRVRG